MIIEEIKLRTPIERSGAEPGYGDWEETYTTILVRKREYDNQTRYEFMGLAQEYKNHPDRNELYTYWQLEDLLDELVDVIDIEKFEKYKKG